MIERYNRYSILWLQQMAIWRVINQNSLAQFTIDHSEIFEVVSFFKSAVLAIESMRDVLFIRIEVVKDYVCV